MQPTFDNAAKDQRLRCRLVCFLLFLKALNLPTSNDDDHYPTKTRPWVLDTSKITHLTYDDSRMAPSGDTHLGGEDVDNWLVNHYHHPTTSTMTQQRPSSSNNTITQRWRPLPNKDASLRLTRQPLLVFEGPVLGPPKDRDWTGPRPIRTGKLKDRLRPGPRSGLRSILIWNLRGPIKNRFKPVSTGLLIHKFICR